MKKSIRTLAMILALTLAFSLLPTSALAVDAESTEQPKAFDLSFKRTDVNYAGSGSLTNQTKFNADNYNTVGSKSTQTKWSLGSPDEGSTILDFTGTTGKVQFLGYGLRLTVGSTMIPERNTLVIKFNVENAGYYDVSFVPYGLTDGGTGAVSIDSETACSKNFYGLEDGALPSEPLYDKIYLSAGEHKITLKSVSAGTGGGYYVAVQSFAFTPSGQLDSAKLEYGKRYVLLSETDGAKLNLSASYSDGKEVDIEKDATVTYESSDEAIATVKQDGTVIPVAEGEVTITAYVTVGEVTKDASLTLRIKEVLPTDPIEFEVDLTALTSTFPDNRLVTGQTTRWYILAGDDVHGENWKVITDASVSNILSGTTKTAVQHYTSYLPINVSSAYAAEGLDTLAFEIEAPAAGIYAVAVIGRSTSGDVEFSASVNGKDIGNWTLNSTKTGVTAGQKVTCASTVAVVLNEGTNIIKIKQGEGSNGFFGFKFTPAGELDTVELSYKRNFIPLSDADGEKLTLSAMYETGAEMDLTDAEISFTSAPDTVATVTDDGIVIPKAEGEVTITAYVTVGKITKECSLTLEILDLEYTEAVFELPEEIQLNETYTLSATAMFDNGSAADAEDVTCSFESDNLAVAEITADNSLVAKELGTANITAHVTLYGETKSITKQIEVVPVTSFTLDFDKVTSDLEKLDPATGGNNRYAVNVNDEFYGSNWKVLTDAESSNIFASRPDEALRVCYYDGGYFSIIKSKAELETGDDTLAIEFTSPISGTFNIDTYMYFGGSTGVAEIFVDGKSVGSFDSNKEANGGKTTKQPANFGKSVTITKGKHLLTIKNTVHEGAGSIATCFYSISFNPSGDLDSVTLSHNKEYILLSDTNGKKLTLSAKYITGTEVDLDGADVVFTSSDESIATVTPDGVVKPVSAGNVTITAKVTDNGITKEDKLTLKINDSAYEKAEIDVVRDLFFEGGTTVISATGILSDGTRLEPEDVTVHFESDNTSVATIEGNVLSTIKEGTANITAYVTFNNVEKSVSKEIKVVPVALAGIEAKTEDAIISLLDADGSKLVVTGINNDGSIGSLDGAEFAYEALTPRLVSVDGDGNVRAIGRGPAQVKVTASLGGIKFECIAEVIASSEKTEPTLYTDKMRENALDNISKYDWAKDTQKSAIANAEYWLANYEKLYDTIMYEGIPRAFCFGLHDSPTAAYPYECAYCKVDIRNVVGYGSYGWITDPISRPFKVQCPSCKRLFPSNEFDDFYKLGLDQKGQFDRVRALENHRAMLLEKGEMLPDVEISEERKEAISAGTVIMTDAERDYYGYGNPKGYLYNALYRDIEKDLGIAANKVNTFAVDDGFGWDTREKASTGVPIMKAFIPFYHHKLYSHNGDNFLAVALSALTNAYLYTGDIKYGRAGAILIDRIADVYPSFDLTQWPEYQNSHGGRNTGKIIGAIWECGLSEVFARAYDAFYPAMDDPEVISFLSNKAAQFGLENPKTSGDLIRENCDNGILREILKGAKEDKIQGNFGAHQLSVAAAAVALDTYPETGEMLDWLGKPMARKTKTITKYGKSYKIYTSNSGGEMLSQYVNDVDRDGFGYEVGAGYNQSWISNSSQVAEILYRYGKHTGFNPYNDPKYRKMFSSIYNMTMAGNYTVQLGDDERTASTRNKTSASTILLGFKRLKNPLYAQILYNLMGGNLDGLYIDIFEENAESVQAEIEKIVEEQGEYELGSRNLTGFGLTVLSGGKYIKNSGALSAADFRRDTWMFYGVSSQSHAHYDKLQMGIDAYGFNFTPDLGYPEATGSDPNRMQWVSATISHNTVVVDGKNQNGVDFGYPYHYDGDGQVKLIDVDAPAAYDATDIYRRTLVSVDASDEVAYTIDFFRVRGGDEHIYSFHTQSADGVTTNDLNLKAQVDGNGNYVGSYAGADVKPEGDPGGNSPNNLYPIGYAWLRNVRRDEAPKSGNFSVNFKQTDFKKQVKDSKGLNLKFTALNDWAPSSIGIVAGDPPRRQENAVIPHLDYMLIHRTGRNLDTLFTSVIQPYKGEEYIESMSSVSLICNGEEEKNDASRAVKVKLKSGRTDYIIYTTNNELTYTLTDGDVSFDFSGFVGVYSVNEEGKNIYSYVNDGTKIGGLQSEARYSGKVKSFTKDLVDKNEITVTLEKELTAEEIAALAGEYVYIDSDGKDNAVYKIESASGSETTVTLDVGDVTTVRGFISASNPDGGYVYNIAEGSKLYIPLSFEAYNRPVVEKIDDATVSAGSSITLQINAEAADGEALTYIGTVVPRGASINSETGKITWKPDSSQVGENGFFITVRDESGRESTVSFTVTVYGSTTGSGNKNEENSGTSSENAGTTGGGGGGGGAAPENPGTSDKTDTDKTEGGEKSPEASGETDIIRFTDLGNYAWAADAINSLADDGIIRGTTSDTYSPGHNITRADFASLLVRAFDLKSDNTENFADVSASDYFASELAIARNTGLVNGIGDNKFAPRNTITRQDMMVIVYRALTALNEPPLPKGRGTVEDGGGISPSQYSDFTTVADYAKEAVSALISAGLVNGKSGRIAPTDYTTRAEVAVLIKRILDYVKK